MCGVLVLVSLGFWQVHRLSWKQAILSDIDNTITAEPVELNLELITRKDQYLPVRAEGQILQEEAHVLISLKTKGAGYRLISIGQMKSIVLRPNQITKKKSGLQEI